MNDLLGVATEGSTLRAGSIPESGNVLDCIILEGDRWGSSGFYPKEVLQRDADKFKEGTRVFRDHFKDGQEEESDKLIGALAGDARYVESDPEANGKPTLRAPIEFFSDTVQWVKERARRRVIALSINAGVKFSTGTRQGRHGKIVTAFTEAFSVDVVTRAGAGGAFGAIKESAPAPGSDHQKTGEGEKVALDKSDIDALGGVFAEAMKPLISAVTALDAKVTESQKPVLLSAAELASKVGAAKLGEKASKRVFDSVAAESEKATADFVDGLIAREAEIRAEAEASVKEAFKAGTLKLDEDEQGGDTGKVNESDDIVSAWAVKE